MINFKQEACVIDITESSLTHPTHGDGLVDSGDVVKAGSLIGVAALDAAASTDSIPVATKGVFNLPATAFDGSVNSAIAVGDKLYMADADAKASGTLTSDATAPADGATVTIGSRVYTFKTTLTGAANEVLIGASAAAALDNLKSAINGTAGAGSTYGTGTVAHADVDATTNTDTTQLVVAKVNGGSGNGIATTETSSHLSWGATTLLGGTSIGELNKDSSKTGIGIALEAVSSGGADNINVLLKKTF